MIFRKDLIFPPAKKLTDMPVLCTFNKTVSSLKPIPTNSINHSVFGAQKSPFLPLNRLSISQKNDEIRRYQNLLWKREAESTQRGYHPSTKFNLFKLSADSGDTDSMYTVGMLYLYESMKTRKKAFKYFSVASDLGHAPSQYCLAMILMHDLIVKANIEKALRLLRKSSDSGYHEAQYAYGLSSLVGFMFPINEKKAYDLFSLSAKQGNKKAQLLLGYSHAQGIGVKKDELKGIKIMRSVFDRNNFPSWDDGYFSFAKYLDKLVFHAKKIDALNQKMKEK